MDRKPEKRNAAVEHTHLPGDVQQRCLHDAIVTASGVPYITHECTSNQIVIPKGVSEPALSPAGE